MSEWIICDGTPETAPNLGCAYVTVSGSRPQILDRGMQTITLESKEFYVGQNEVELAEWCSGYDSFKAIVCPDTYKYTKQQREHFCNTCYMNRIYAWMKFPPCPMPKEENA